MWAASNPRTWTLNHELLVQTFKWSVTNKHLYKPNISSPVLNSPTHTGQHFPCGTWVTRQDSGSSGHCGDFSSQKLRPLIQLHCSHSFFHQVEPFVHMSPSSTQASLSSGNITFICRSSVSYKEQCNAHGDTAFVCTVSYCVVIHLIWKHQIQFILHDTPCYHQHHTFCGVCTFSSCYVPSTHQCFILPASDCLTQGFKTQDVPLVYSQGNLH